MIAFSCVHCGERMRITEEEGSKRAICGKCKQVVLIPTSEPGIRTPPRRASEANPKVASSPPLVSRTVRAGEETRAGTGAAIHEIPTHVERVSPSEPHLTAFLAPAQGAEEIGRLGPYRILEVVGAGGMGVVYRAHDPALDRLVALKAMLPWLARNATGRQRFLREARLAAAIQHDHVVTIFQVGEDRGIPFLAMPFLRGETLEARMHREPGPFALGEALRIGRELGEGLGAIHELGLVHRDIKPGNIFLEGESRRVKILDFGLARAVAGDVRLTHEGSLLGSPAFMAPEQASRQPVDARADLFSLGCVMYQMLTGSLPFEGEDVLTTVLAIQNEQPIPIHERNPLIPEEVSAWVLRLLAKKPEDRPASVRKALEELKERTAA